MSNVLIDSRCSEEGNDEDYKEEFETNNRQPTPDLVPFRRNVNEEEVTIASDRNEGSDTLLHTPAPNDSPESRMNVEQDYVSAVVVKAKRAAHSLWLLIHAQVSEIQQIDVCCLQILSSKYKNGVKVLYERDAIIFSHLFYELVKELPHRK
jgi:hypothetical protein